MYTLLTHNDLDGVGCGILAKLAFGDKVEVRYNSISSLNRQVEHFLEKNDLSQILMITDLSVNEKNEEGIEEFISRGGKVTLIDHHITAIHLNQYDWGYVAVEDDEGRPASATSLLYTYLIKQGFLAPSKAADEFVELVRLYDTWEWDRLSIQDAKRLNDLFFMFSIEEFEEKMFARLSKSEEFTFDELEMKLLDIEENKIDRYIRRKKREVYQTFIEGECAGIVHAESYHSELGNELMKEFSHLDYIAIVMVGGKRISLRTTHDHIDVSKVAARYQGGGHQKASGCNLTQEGFSIFVEQPFLIEPLKADAFHNRYNIKEPETFCLFSNHNQDIILISREADEEWKLEINREVIGIYPAFMDAERVVKRKYYAWLVRDDQYVEFLRKRYLEKQ
ncbi:oligoribonuclease NrnB/cAMP/cGMP phosphodiesterase (DHH superfamily) [Peribacillus deserti]|uniref:Oligoribonuclease NrnB/cAMP/cGMP phosphodiesterase (DHH superfamily) n=1 Tax=Peribacillus deserti TaxID=673318 RepID=A0ABS2QKZ3_9BACI|nr:oligoribonuclease [Peribacillus deserti]MBM7693843.1 oligoribonuclease NrnB/cAMP/cGMP phosphodiesterase (DHH superfamily) [Peribacillus deserti]